MKKLYQKLELLPDTFGVYLMKDANGEVIYAGKALSIRKRVRSYFGNSEKGAKIKTLIKACRDLDYIATGSEAEALILECNLIKKYRPRYNVRFRDDKKYPYIRISADTFPAISVTRTIKKDNSRYYGPYANAGALRRTVKFIRKIFMLRSCKRDMSKKSKPCLYHDLAQCVAPCKGDVPQKEYANIVDSVLLFLEGRREELIANLNREMMSEARKMNYEKAASLRDKIHALKKVFEQQRMDSIKGGNEDYLSCVVEGHLACVGVFPFRAGKLSGQQQFMLEGAEKSDCAEVLSSFIKQFYQNAAVLPERIFVSKEIEDRASIEKYLMKNKKTGKQVRISAPKRGKRKELIEQLERNSMLKLKEEETMKLSEKREEITWNLKELLALDVLPSRIEAFDISQTAGSDPAGSLVVFKNGEPQKKNYRHFKIKASPAKDDCAMIKEIVGRRYKRLLNESCKMPELILIDGGQGQVDSALSALKELNIEKTHVIGLAKQFENIFLPQSGKKLFLPSDSPSLNLLKYIRDEAHRFALLSHRRLRDRKMHESILDEIRGLGENRKKLLLQHFGSLEAIRNANKEDFKKVGGIGEKLASVIKKHL